MRAYCRCEGGSTKIKWLIGVKMCGSGAEQTAAMNSSTLRSFTPGDDSTPLATSTPHGRTTSIASATLAGVSPPARISGTPGSKPASNCHGAR